MNIESQPQQPEQSARIATAGTTITFLSLTES
jgi:hypothetical protein